MYLGDVAPFVAPANGLAERGHDVTFLAPAGFHGLLGGERFGLATYPLDCSARVLHADPEHRRLMRHPVRNATRLARYWMRVAFLDDPGAVRAGVLAALDGADAVLVHPTLACVVAPVAHHLGVPVAVGHLFPMMVPTAARAFPVDRHAPDLGPRANRALWRSFTWASGVALHDRALNDWRRSLGAAPRRGNAFGAWAEAERLVMLVSPHYAGEAPADWPPVTWAGFSHWGGPAGAGALADDVGAYLDAGDAPVLVTLGTSAATGAGRWFARVADGIDRLGLRSLLLVGDPANLAALGGRAGAFAFAPLAPALRRSRVAVVSGSLGSLAAALAAGVPVVVVPQLFDQVWHGGRVEALGVGVLARRARDVAPAVARIEADPGYRQRAAALAAAMAGEDAAATTADVVESLLPR